MHLDQLLSHPARDATWAITATGGDPRRARAAGPRGRRRANGRRGARGRRAPARDRVAKVTVSESQPSRTTADAVAMGITGTVSSLRDDLRRRSEPDPQRPARRAPRERQADRARRDVLVQPGDRRAHRREGLPRGARDHQRRGADRARRRRLPGLDDGLQRRLRGRPADHRHGRTTRSTSRTIRSAGTRRSTIPTSTSSSSTTPPTGCCCGRSSAPTRSS